MKDNQLQIVSYSQAVKLREAGFDWNTSHYYEKVMVNGLYRDIENDRVLKNSFIADWGKYKLSAPTVALALKWFRDVKGLTAFCDDKYHGWHYEIYSIGCDAIRIDGNDLRIFFETYEEAESALLDELLTIIEDKQ